MACDRFSGALRAHALGGRLEAAGAAHLAICEGCQEQLARERELARLIEGAIATVGAEVPPADFRVRLADRIVARPVRPPRVWPKAVALVGSVAAVLAVLVALNSSRQQQSRDRMPPAETPSASSGLVVPVLPEAAAFSVNAAPAAVLRDRPRPYARAAVAVRTTTPAFEVLVPQGQRESLVRLVASLSQQEPGVAARLLGRPSDVRDAGEMTPRDVTVTTLIIQPVVIPALAEPRAILDNEE